MTDPQRKTNPRAGGDGRAVHDLGGLPDGSIDREEHAITLFEQRVDSLLFLLIDDKRHIFRVDALRRAIEDYSQGEYDGLGYYERWVQAIRNLLVEQEVLSADEIDAKMAEVRRRLEDEGITVVESAT
jgi:DNA-binding SARP family transcriptional activator